jgi:lipoate-protein ligase A
MRHCDLTLPTPEENLACDEALLELCEAGSEDEVLRFWQPTQHFVVIGYSNSVETEVNVAFCQGQGVPILRRCTGGGTVLQGPGCLNYSLVLRIEGSDGLHSVATTNEFILQRQATALSALLGARVERKGQTDLAIGGLKFSGNAQRRKKRFLLFHGSFLLHFDLDLLEKALPMPSRQPDYRLGRGHVDFLMNLRVPEQRVKTALAECWSATEPLERIPLPQIAALIRDKYGRDEWNLRR